MSKKPSLISAGFALFSMFFGAGNIIFPLIVGRLSGTKTAYALLGLGFSAVLFPLLGLMAMMLYGGKLLDFLSRLGKWPALAMLFILQMSQGPVGAMPRLITLMHASIKSYLPISLGVFSIASVALLFLLVIRPQRIIAILGSILTPFFLVSMGILIIAGMFSAPDAQPVLGSGSHYFGIGLKMGYQTTDLIAALLFAGLLLPHLAQGARDAKELRRNMTYASLIASGLLMASYVGLCWLAAHYHASDAAPEELLQRIALQVLGPWGGIVSAIAVFLACLTTAISLAAVFANYLREVIPFQIQEGAALGLTLGLTACMANLGFSGIVKLWSPILEVLYPALIVLCCMNIAHSLYRIQPVRVPVFFVLGFAMGGYYFG